MFAKHVRHLFSIDFDAVADFRGLVYTNGVSTPWASVSAGAPDPAPPPKKKISMLSKFKKAGNMIAMSNRMVKLRPTEVQYYNSAFAIFDLDFDKDKTKVEKSKPSWMATKMTKFGEALSSPTGGKNQAKASQSSSSDDSDDSSDEDFSL